MRTTTRRRFIKYGIGSTIGTALGIAGWEYYSYPNNKEETSREFDRSLYPPKELRVGSRGVCYSVGGRHPYRDFSWEKKNDIETIHDELGCNAIRIYGDAEDPLIECTNMAVEKGFKTIILSPRWVEATIEETLTNFDRFTRKVGSLRDPSLILAVGNELSIDVKGIFDSASIQERVAEIRTRWDDKKRQKKLEELLRSLITIARRNTDIKLSYAAGSWEWMMPWDDLDLDILGDNHYWYGDYGDPTDPENMYIRHIREYKKYGKPYFITEFGSCPYLGAFDLGSGSYMGARGPKNEDAQAQYAKNYMELFNKADDLSLTVDCCCWFNYLWTDVADETNLVEKGFIDHFRKAFFMLSSYYRHQ